MATSTFAIDQLVFVKHPKKSWIPGYVTGRVPQSDTYVITDEEHDEVKEVHDYDMTLCSEQQLQEGVDPVCHDLLYLTILHDATLLRCLKVRFLKDIVYTNIGAIVVAVNPFNFKIPWYVESNMAKYLAEGDVIRVNLPHSWAVAHNTYYEMRSEKNSQTIIVSGESGAGKTEACKMVMKYLGSVSMLNASQEQKAAADQMCIKIQQSSPILEGFGNAKTVRNDNSSRFGKFVKVKFHPSGALTGAFTINYLLEKSRIVGAAAGERVYHAFYHLTKGKDASKYNIQPPQSYKSTNSGKCLSISGVDDSADYNAVLTAMTTMGISEQQQTSVWRAVAGCLTAQNIELTPVDTDSTTVVDSTEQFLEETAKHWGIPPTQFKEEILTTTSTVRGETFTMTHKLAQAIDMRDAVCKHLYEKLFIWLVSKINESTDSEEDSSSWVGVLDIFGFEDFEKNSFEQLCINLANETLQNHYNSYIFKRDLEECRSEGINVDDYKCPDNSQCLAMITDTTGILGLLDEVCRLGTGTDDSFLEKVIQCCSKNPFFDRKPTSRGNFIVRHYAGNVTYDVAGFLDKNRDTLKDGMKCLLRSSVDALISQLLPAPVDRVGKAPTVGGFYKLQLAELMFLINSTSPHWIRCIKPHPARKPLMFDGLSVTGQLQSSGILGTVKVRKAGYPVRMLFSNFFGRYKILFGKCSVSAPIQEQHDAVRRAMKASKTTQREVQIGKTRIFMKSEAYLLLEKAREEAGVSQRLLLQSSARATVSQLERRKRIWRESAMCIQDEFRDYLRRSAVVRQARRKQKEEMLAKQKAERSDFYTQAMGAIESVMTEYDEELKKIFSLKRAHLTWLDDKATMDSEERAAFFQYESRNRNELFATFREALWAYEPHKQLLNIMALPGVEIFTRSAITRDEEKEIRIYRRLFMERGAAMFRLEIERTERRYRRMLQRLEDLQFSEMTDRITFLPFICKTKAKHL